MNNYTEATVEKKVTFSDILLKAAAWFLVLVVLAAGFLFTSALVIFIGILLGLGAAWLLPSLKVTYEYVYCDGQIDFDKIMNGEKRKHICRTDLDQAVVIAPADSHELDSFRFNNTPKKDFTSKTEGPEHKVYALVESSGELQTIYYFEPSEKMLDMMRHKAPSKCKF